MTDAQARGRGMLPDCVPTVWPCHGNGDPGWSVALWLIADGIVTRHDDPVLQAELYPALKWGADVWIGQVGGGRFPYAW